MERSVLLLVLVVACAGFVVFATTEPPDDWTQHPSLSHYVLHEANFIPSSRNPMEMPNTATCMVTRSGTTGEVFLSCVDMPQAPLTGIGGGDYVNPEGLPEMENPK